MRILSALICLIYSITGFSQTQDLIALAQGDYLGMNALINEKGDLFGYISIYGYGKSGDKTKKFEYVILDKNLNPFANNTFDGDITCGNYVGYINFNGKIILRPNTLDVSLVKKDELFFPSSMIIDLKDNSIKRKVFYDYDHGTFTEMTQHTPLKDYKKEFQTEKKKNGYNYVSMVSEIREGGFLILEYDDYGSYEKNTNILRYDENKKELWRYEYNKNGSKSESQTLRILGKNEDHIYGLLKDKAKRTTQHYLVVIDMKTGTEIHRKEIPDPENVLPAIRTFPTSSYGILDNDKTFDDKIVIVGRKYTGVFNDYTAVSRLLINKKTFEAELRVLHYKGDFQKWMDISSTGHVENNWIIDPRDIFFLKDGSVGFLFEKLKPSSDYAAQKTTDMVYVYTDKDFNITGVKVLKKDKSRWPASDYLFSQNLNDDKDVVFFYRDYQKDSETKDRNWNLFINTHINGVFNQEMIPISSRENFFIIPYIAKEGYILLQEFNAKAKYNQVRLERLNY